MTRTGVFHASRQGHAWQDFPRKVYSPCAEHLGLTAVNPALQLYRLQLIEQGARRAERRLLTIADTLADDAELQSAEARCQKVRDELKPLRSRLRDLELETAGNEEKIRNTGEQLYSGAVKSPREMQDMQLEVASLQRRNGDLETWSLETMLAMEEAEARLAAGEAALAEVVERRGEEQRELLQERDALQASLPQRDSERKAALASISPELQKTYFALKPRKGGQPVARLEGNSCALCGVSQTLTVEREVRYGRRLVTCANCGRILVAPAD